MHPEFVHVYRILGKVETYSSQVIDIEFTGSLCALLALSLELMIAI